MIFFLQFGLGRGWGPKSSSSLRRIAQRKFCVKFLDPQTPHEIIFLFEIPRTQCCAGPTLGPMFMCCAGPTIKPNVQTEPRAGQRKQQNENLEISAFHYRWFWRGWSRALSHQGLEDELNDLGREGWELTAVTDAGDAKIFILKQPDIVDPLALA